MLCTRKSDGRDRADPRVQYMTGTSASHTSGNAFGQRAGSPDQSCVVGAWGTSKSPEGLRQRGTTRAANIFPQVIAIFKRYVRCMVMSALLPKADIRSRCWMSASLIGRLGSSAFRLPSLRCRCRSRALASLRNRHQGPCMGRF